MIFGAANQFSPEGLLGQSRGQKMSDFCGIFVKNHIPGTGNIDSQTTTLKKGETALDGSRETPESILRSTCVFDGPVE